MTKAPRFSPRNDTPSRTRTSPVTASTVSVSIRLPPELHRWLSIRALDTRSSIQQIMVDAVETVREREARAGRS